jgi:hypothetical protein
VTLAVWVAAPVCKAVTVIWKLPSAVGVATVTKVDPGAAAAVEAAVRVTVAGFGGVAGDVYNPLPSTVPFTLPPTVDQATLWLVVPLTVAVNCCCVAATGHMLPASSANKVANPGFTVTVMGGGVVLPLPATAPQEISASNQNARKIHASA